MKKIKIKSLEIFNSKTKEWEEIEYSSMLYYTNEEPQERTYLFKEFWHDLENYIQTKDQHKWEHTCSHSSKTFFKKTPCVILDGWVLGESLVLFKKDYPIIKFRTNYKEAHNVTMEDLLKRMSHEQFIEYLKDNEIFLKVLTKL